MAGADRISSLPSELKVSILSCLSVKDAIRTSTLARSWRHVWNLLPCLSLGIYEDLLGDTDDTTDIPVKSSWIERVHHLVSSLRGPLLVFELFHCFHFGQSTLLQSLLDLLLKKIGVEKLGLWIQTQVDPVLLYPVVLYLPSFHSLKELSLSGCLIILPTGFLGFNRLTTLNLNEVHISSDDLHSLVHTSNNLTTLVILNIVATEKPLLLNFSLPLLRHLTFGINESVENASVVCAPCLDQAHIYIWNYTDSKEKLASVALRLVTSAVTVSSLNLDFDVLKLESEFSSQSSWVAIPMREFLVKKHGGLSCLDQTLKSVRIRTESLIDVMTSIAVVKFFLVNANVLRLLKIAHWTGSEVMPIMIEDLQKTKVASSDAKVVIHRHGENVTFDVR